MGTNLNSVDLTTLTEGTFVHVGLDHGGTMHLHVDNASEGRVTIYVAGLKPMEATITNEADNHVLALGDTLNLGDRSTPRTVTSLDIGGGLFQLSIPGGTPEDLVALAEFMREQTGVDVLGFGQGNPPVAAAR